MKYDNFQSKEDDLAFREKFKFEFDIGTPIREVVKRLPDPSLDLLKKFKFPKVMIETLEKESNEGEIKGFLFGDDYPNLLAKKEKIISNYTFSLMTSFFSLLEYILEIFYLFQPREVLLEEFRKKRWFKKFKYIFPVQHDIKIKKIYDALRDFKGKYRNPLTHGMISSVNYLIPMPPYGLKPISHDYLTGEVQFRDVQIRKEDALEIIGTFEDLLDYIVEINPYNFYTLFLHFDFPIPINVTEINKIKSNMGDLEDFWGYIMDRLEYRDRVINREI